MSRIKSRQNTDLCADCGATGKYQDCLEIKIQINFLTSKIKTNES